VAAQATAHLASNLWLISRFGASSRRDGLSIEVDGLAVPARA
jgi:hypothetical protein